MMTINHNQRSNCLNYKRSKSNFLVGYISSVTIIVGDFILTRYKKIFHYI